MGSRMWNQQVTLSIYLSYLTAVLVVVLIGSANGTISVVSQITETIIISFDDSPSISMPDEKVEYGIDGYLVYSTPADACTKVLPPPRDPEDVNWILLAKHTPSTPECSFGNKTEYALDAGYAGIIIHNIGSNSTDDFDEAVDPSETIIYATFIGEYHGFMLRDNFSYPGDKYFKTFIRVRHDESTTNQWLVYLVAFLVILCFCALLVVPILMLWNSALTCLEKIRRIRRRKLRIAIINKFPINDWAEGDPQQSCVICLDDFEPHDKVRILPCSHGFHAECIDPWLQKCKKFCPICKRKVIVLSENVETAAASDSDDETAPLLRREPTTSAASPSINSPSTTSGGTAGTFAQQTENPFRRAIRMARRAAGRQPSTSVAVPNPETESADSIVPAAHSGPSTSVPSSNDFVSTSSSASSGDVDHVPFRTRARHPASVSAPPAPPPSTASHAPNSSTYNYNEHRVLVPEVTVIVNPSASASANAIADDTNDPRT